MATGSTMFGSQATNSIWNPSGIWNVSLSSLGVKGAELAAGLESAACEHRERGNRSATIPKLRISNPITRRFVLLINFEKSLLEPLYSDQKRKYKGDHAFF